MVILLKQHAPQAEQERLLAWLRELGAEVRVTGTPERPFFCLTGDISRIDPSLAARFPAVEDVLRLTEPYPLCSRRLHPEPTVVSVGGARFGGGNFGLIAGPCAVESEEQIFTAARQAKAAGVCLLRGGAFKPRTSPYAFQGLGTEGILAMAAARKATGMPIVSELMSEALAAFERIRTGDMGVSGSKADPKDGDFHGDPSRPVAPRSADMGVDGVNSEDTDDALNSQFEDLMRDIDFDEVTFAVPDETANDSSGVDDGSAQGVHDGALDAGLIGFGDFDGNGDDPLSQLRKNPTVRNLVTVTFTRSEFMERLGECGLSDPTGTYRMFDAEMDVDGLGALKPVDATFDLRDSRFSPSGSQEEPELSDAIFDHDTAQLFGCRDMSGLSIQRVDLLQRAVGEFHRIAQDSHLESVAKAKQAMDVINTIADPELTSLAPQVTSALIDGKDTPDFSFRLADELDAERIKARDLLFSGQVDQSVELAEAALGRMDRLFASNPGVPRYFN